ncbi:uncharacterized protein BYT42DRAFT_588919 [Radiomyces spectabilis]|uniref:uncharacterized protein n=1 Tax=Radiomyces spectabilis TaxID=64574 RepID=UPI00221EAC12|nr:uncharacterized protein BYT42DRAFT_588919 [Radiomyces spectabilis]KAI8366099.1 hypothetical protein BYT42DRAFT_588919 [Radiomyces spectabilis]
MSRIANTESNTKAVMAFSLLGDLIDECIYDVLFEVHRDIKSANAVCQICQTKCRSYATQSGTDIFGNSYSVNNLPFYECVHCHKSIASSRYAPHLEKCLGLSGRQSSRVANRRMGTTSPSLSSDDNSASETVEIIERKKKKAPSVSIIIPKCIFICRFDIYLFFALF